MSVLRATRGGKSVEYPLTNGGVTVGTARECQIVVADPAGAPKHCQIVKGPTGFVVIDRSGAPGTFVNGKKVQDHLLKQGDVIQIGAEKFIFVESNPAPAAAGGGAAPVRRLPTPNRPVTSGAAKAPAATASATKSPVAKRPPSGPRKLTVKPGSVARVHKAHSLFVLPSTRKGRVIALSVGVGLLALGGVLFAASMGQVNSEEVKKQCLQEVQACLALPDAEVFKKATLGEGILANPDYRKYSPVELRPLEKAWPEIKARAELEKKAGTEVKAFLDKYRDLKEGPPAEYEKQSDSLYDQVKLHLDAYGTTTFGPKLTEVRNEVMKYLENRMSTTWTAEVVQLRKGVQKAIDAATYGAALVTINEFGAKFREAENKQLAELLQGEREKVQREARKFVEKLKSAEGSKEEKRKAMEAARPGLKGCGEAEKLLEKYINESK